MNIETRFSMNMDELESFEFPFDEFFCLTVINNNVKYQFMVRLASKNNNLICFGSGGYDPEKITPPIFRSIAGKNISENL